MEVEEQLIISVFVHYFTSWRTIRVESVMRSCYNQIIITKEIIMKKKRTMSFVVLGVIVVLLTGCFGGGQTLTCRSIDEDEFFGTEETVETFTFRNGELRSTSTKNILTVVDEMSDYIGELKEMFEEEFSDYTGIRGLTTSVRERSGVITIEVNIDFGRIDADDLDELPWIIAGDAYYLLEYNSTLDEIRESREIMGMTCN